MSAESDKMRDTFTDQLASYDNKLHASGNSVQMLADIQDGIGQLLESSASSEDEIRRVLQEQYDTNGLRKETFQLVNSILDLYVTENVSTFPIPRKLGSRVTEAPPPVPETDESPDGGNDFGTTTVIPVEVAADATADGAVQVGSVLRDRFVLQEKVSGGSMGVVYKALDRRLAESGVEQHWVAIKVLSPQLAENGKALRALQQEAAKGRCLIHPNIVRFVDLDREDELYFLVMEWLEGRTLANILDSKDRSIIDRDAAFRIVSQVGDALDYAHRCGIVHADIKPDNVMIMPNGDAKLFDFGVARVRQKHAEAKFDPGVLSAMTPAYSSMQVLTGDEPVVADDIFSLACLMYRLVAGYRVFGPRNAAEASQEGLKPQRVKSLSDSQWRALNKALSYSRVARFKTMREFLDALEQSSSEPLVVAPRRYEDYEKPRRTGRTLLLLIVLLGAIGGFGYKFGYLDALLHRIDELSVSVPPGPITDETIAVPVDEKAADDSIDATPAIVEAPQVDDVVEEPEPEIPHRTAMGPNQSLVDFSTLPRATLVVAISTNRGVPNSVDITIREDQDPTIVDFVRDGDLSTSMTLRLEEVGFSGNRSPWAAGQYSYSNSGIVNFPAGQERGRVTLTMASDPLREADQQSTLRIRETDYSDSALAVLNVTLEDDDQRAFESRLPVNTVAFAVSQASIRETDPAVQIDIVRFNPDATTVVVGFQVKDITATEGEDYFAPGSHSITFGPGQRSARLLIPLVQDVAVERDEAFVVELFGDPKLLGADVYQRIVVMIRDDEPRLR